MALLGQLTVGILGDLSGYSNSLSAAQKETVKFSKGIERIGRDISTIGYAAYDTGKTLTKTITAPVVALGTALAGLTIKKGFDRLLAIDTAKAKLEALGHSAKNVDLIMDSALASVKGTAFGLGDAATAAASAVAAGIKPGKELTQYLTNVGDAAAIAGVEFSDMGSIFNKIQTGGKATRMELNQLADRGLPIFQWLADAAGVSEDAIQEMVTNGAISSELFNQAIEKNIGGAAQIMGAKSFSAALANVGAAIGRVGASFLDGQGEGEGFFSQLKPLMADFTDKIDNMGDFAQKAGVKFGEMFANMINKVKDVKQWFDGLDPSIQGLIKKVTLFGSVGAVAAGPILMVFGKLIVTVGNIVTRFGALMGAVTKLGGLFGILTGPIGIAIGIFAALIAAGVLLYKNWDTVKEKAQTVFTSFAPLLDVVKGSFQSLLDSVGPIMDSLKTLWQSLIPILEMLGAIVGGVLVTAFGVAISIFSATVAAIGPLINAVISLADFVVNMVNLIIAVLTGDFAGAMEFWNAMTESSINFFVGLWEGVVNFFKTFIDTIVDFFYGLYMTLVGNSIIPDMVNAIVEWFSNMFQWVIDIVMMIVDGITEAFMLIYETVSNYIEMVLEIVTSVWDYIKDTFANALAFIVALVTGDFKGMRDAINAQMENVKKLISNIWKAIDSFLSKTLGGIWDTVKRIFSNIFSTISSILGNVRSTVTNIWNGIRNVITSVLNGIRSVVSSVWNGIRSTISSVMNGIRSVITSIWNGIRNTISSVVNGIKSTVTSTFNSIKSSATSIFNAVKTAMTNPIETAKNTIKRSIDAVKGFFSGLKLKFPKISMPKLPKFTLKGKFSLMPPSVPKIGINWNAVGGIFKRPTIFNTANAGLQGVGEAGAEAIIPLNNKTLGTLGEMIGKTIPNNNDNLASILIEQNNILMKLLKKDTNVYLDTDGLYKEMDSRFSNDFSLDSYFRGQRK